MAWGPWVVLLTHLGCCLHQEQADIGLGHRTWVNSAATVGFAAQKGSDDDQAALSSSHAAILARLRAGQWGVADAGVLLHAELHAEYLSEGDLSTCHFPCSDSFCEVTVGRVLQSPKEALPPTTTVASPRGDSTSAAEMGWLDCFGSIANQMPGFGVTQILVLRLKILQGLMIITAVQWRESFIDQPATAHFELYMRGRADTSSVPIRLFQSLSDASLWRNDVSASQVQNLLALRRKPCGAQPFALDRQF